MNGLMGGIGAGLTAAAKGLRENRKTEIDELKEAALLKYRSDLLKNKSDELQLKREQEEAKRNDTDANKRADLQAFGAPVGLMGASAPALKAWHERQQEPLQAMGQMQARKAMGLMDRSPFVPGADYVKAFEQQVLSPKHETRIVPEVGADGNPVNVAYGLMGGKLDPASRQVLGQRPTSDGISMTSPDGTTVQIGGTKVASSARNEAIKRVARLKASVAALSDYRQTLREIGNAPALGGVNKSADVVRLQSALNNAILSVGPDMAIGALQQHEQEMVKKILGGDPTTIGSFVWQNAAAIDAVLAKVQSNISRQLHEQSSLAQGDAAPLLQSSLQPSQSAQSLIDEARRGRGR